MERQYSGWRSSVGSTMRKKELHKLLLDAEWVMVECWGVDPPSRGRYGGLVARKWPERLLF